MIAQPISSAKPASSSPDDRATSFEAQEGSPIPEAHSGERLLVTAYVAIWIIVMIFVQVIWFRQRAISRRLASLERAIDKAEQKKV